MIAGFSRMSLLWKILLSTSVALTTLFAVTVVIVQRQVTRTTYRTLDNEVNGSFQAYDSLWRARTEKLALASVLLSRMSDVRAAFRTGDQATIRDTAGELWAAVSDQQALFLVSDPEGRVIASLGGAPESFLNGKLPVISAAAKRFPRESAGFVLHQGNLYQVVVTPVYVDTARGEALLNVLVTGYLVDSLVARRFKETCGGSEFTFLSAGHVIASTLPEGVGSAEEYASIAKPLLGLDGTPVGELRIDHSFAAARQNFSALLRDVYLIWLAAIFSGLALTWWLARRIMEPIGELDRAAAEIAKENYEVRVTEHNRDEIGRLGRTFNRMCAALQSARANLIRQERIATISRLSSSIVHDLRNPLAAIYGGAEMLVDMDLPPATVKRLATNIHSAAGYIRQLLADLADITRGKMHAAENCNPREVIIAAWEASATAAENQGVEIDIDVPEGLEELPLERSRMERVFINLIGNALEAMPNGGQIRITAHEAADGLRIQVEDNGPGIPEEIRARLFEPFVTAGKKDGLGLGLALARQTVLDHGGDMWTEPAAGARFVIRLPRKR
jgi:signal transduction histidine kinase